MNFKKLAVVASLLIPVTTIQSGSVLGMENEENNINRIKEEPVTLKCDFKKMEFKDSMCSEEDFEEIIKEMEFVRLTEYNKMSKDRKSKVISDVEKVAFKEFFVADEETLYNKMLKALKVFSDTEQEKNQVKKDYKGFVSGISIEEDEPGEQTFRFYDLFIKLMQMSNGLYLDSTVTLVPYQKPQSDQGQTFYCKEDVIPVVISKISQFSEQTGNNWILENIKKLKYVKSYKGIEIFPIGTIDNNVDGTIGSLVNEKDSKNDLIVEKVRELLEGQKSLIKNEIPVIDIDFAKKVFDQLSQVKLPRKESHDSGSFEEENQDENGLKYEDNENNEEGPRKEVVVNKNSGGSKIKGGKPKPQETKGYITFENGVEWLYFSPNVNKRSFATGIENISMSNFSKFLDGKAHKKEDVLAAINEAMNEVPGLKGKWAAVDVSPKTGCIFVKNLKENVTYGE